MRKVILSLSFCLLTIGAGYSIPNLPQSLAEKKVGGEVRIEQPIIKGDGNLSFETSLNGENVNPDKLKKRIQTRHGSEELTMYEVTPNIIYDREAGQSLRYGLQFAVPCGGMIEEGMLLYSCFVMEMGEDVMIFPWNLPAGKFDFITMTSSEDKGVFCVIKEGITVDKNMTIDFDMAEATNHIVFDPRLPDGETPHPWIDWNTLTELSPGNCANAQQTLGIYHRNGHSVMTFFGNVGLWDLDEDDNFSDSRHQFDIWTNNTTEFSFFQVFTAMKQSGNNYIMPMVAKGCEPQKVTNDYTNFSSICSVFHPSLFDSSTIPDEGFILEGLSSGYMFYINNSKVSHEFSGCYGNSPTEFTTHVSAPETYNEIIKDCSIYPLNSYVQSSSLSGIYGIVAPAAGHLENYWQYQTLLTPANSTSTEMNNFAIAADNPLEYNFYTQYALAPEQNPIFGGSCPITLFIKPNYKIGYDFFGRYGENRSIDLLNHKFTMDLNGVTVCSSWEELSQIYKDWTLPDEWKEFGTWDYMIENSNMMVDDLQGLNKCIVHLEENDVYSSPTVTHLQFRDLSGKVTDRFTTAEGEIYFSAGVWSTYNLIYSPLARVKLAYKPHSDEEWTDLEVKAVGDEPFLPSYGQLYMANASGIARKSDTGWFDLKIEIYDDKGNYQIQEVSPAIKIASMSGIDSVFSQSAPCELSSDAEIYNLNGIRIENTGKILPGIYIVKYNGEFKKVVLK